MPLLPPILSGPGPFGLNAMAAAAQRFTGKRLDPYPGFNFLVEIDGLLTGGFKKVTGLEATIVYEKEYQEGGGREPFPVVKEVSYPALVLSQGMTDIGALWYWFDLARRGMIRRRTVSVVLLDAQQLPVRWWYCLGAFPTKWVGPSFDASNAEVAVEGIELRYRSLRKGALAPLVGLARAGLRLSSFL